MADSRSLHGNHTWELILGYYCCPKCSYIFANQKPFENRFGKLHKILECPHCQFNFTVSKK